MLLSAMHMSLATLEDDVDITEDTSCNIFFKDRCYDHEFVIVSPIDHDHGRIPIGCRDH